LIWRIFSKAESRSWGVFESQYALSSFSASENEDTENADLSKEKGISAIVLQIVEGRMQR